MQMNSKTQKELEALLKQIENNNSIKNYAIVGISSIKELQDIQALSEYVAQADEEPIFCYTRS